MIVPQARKARLTSCDHVSLDGTLIEPWASLKSFRPKDDDNTWGDLRSKKRSNETHASKTGRGEARAEEQRQGGRVRLRRPRADGEPERPHRRSLRDGGERSAERRAALAVIDSSLVGSRRVTLAADRGHDARELVSDLRSRHVTPHVAHTNRRHGAIEHRIIKRGGDEFSQRVRRRIESSFGWTTSTAGMRRSRVRGVQRTQLATHLVAAADSLLRIAKLTAAAT